MIGASTGMFGAVWAQAETRKVLGAMGGRVIEAELPVGHAGEKYADGRLALEPEQAERLDEILAELVEAAEVESGLVARLATRTSSVARASAKTPLGRSGARTAGRRTLDRGRRSAQGRRADGRARQRGARSGVGSGCGP